MQPSARPTFSPPAVQTAEGALPPRAASSPVAVPEPAITAPTLPAEQPRKEVAPQAPGTEQMAASNATHLQQAAVDALTKAGQGSAADAASDATWTLTGDEVQVTTTLSKIMLPVVINPEAEKILRAAIRESGPASLKLSLLPGAGRTVAEKKTRIAREGSAESKALKHPMVIEGKRLFDAEVQTVIDLSETN